MSAIIAANNRFDNSVPTLSSNIFNARSKIKKIIDRAVQVTKDQFQTIDGIKTLNRIVDTSARVAHTVDEGASFPRDVRVVTSEFSGGLNLLEMPHAILGFGYDAYQAVPSIFDRNGSINTKIVGIDTIFFGLAGLAFRVSSALRFLNSEKHKFLSVPCRILFAFSRINAIALMFIALRGFCKTSFAIAHNEYQLTDSPKLNKRFFRVLTFQSCTLLRNIVMIVSASLLLASNFGGAMIPQIVSLSFTVTSLVFYIGLKYYQGILDPKKEYVKI